MLKKKTMRRAEWRGIEKRRCAVMPFEHSGVRGRMGLLYMDEVLAPFSVVLSGSRHTITQTGYSWLQIAPENRHFWMTVMFDEAGQPIENYIDITLENHLPENDDAWFVDPVSGYRSGTERPRDRSGRGRAGRRPRPERNHARRPRHGSRRSRPSSQNPRPADRRLLPLLRRSPRRAASLSGIETPIAAARTPCFGRCQSARAIRFQPFPSGCVPPPTAPFSAAPAFPCG